MPQSVTTILGLARDFIAAGLGLAILFGVTISDDQIAGILLVVTTGVALASYIISNVNSPAGKV